jgi:hypothetical protein
MTDPTVRCCRLLCCLLLLSSVAWAADSVPRFGIFETTLVGPEKLDDPYRQVSVSVVFTGPAPAGSPVITTEAFWDGGGTWKVRISPTEVGQWSWRTTSTTKQLDGKSGKFVCTPSVSDGFLRTDPTRPGLFLRGGKPVFLLGCTGSALSDFSLKDGSFQKYIDTRVAQGFNCLFMSQVDFLKDNESGSPFTDRDHLTPNTAWFQAADQRMYYCRLKGVVPVIGVIFEAKSEQLWRYTLTRYAAFDVIWYVEPSFDKQHTPANFSELTRKLDPYRHPIMTLASNVEKALAREPWVGVIGTGSTDAEFLAEMLSLGKPVVGVVAPSENLAPKDPVEFDPAIRRAAWMAALSGACPFYHVLGVDPAKPETLNSPGARAFTALGEFFRQTGWSQLVPGQDLLSKGDALVRVRPNIEYIAYLPKGGPIALNVAGMKDGFWVQWFDPRAGKIASSIQLPARPLLETEAPDNVNDWVLHLSRVKPRPQE